MSHSLQLHILHCYSFPQGSDGNDPSHSFQPRNLHRHSFPQGSDGDGPDQASRQTGAIKQAVDLLKEAGACVVHVCWCVGGCGCECVRAEGRLLTFFGKKGVMMKKEGCAGVGGCECEHGVCARAQVVISLKAEGARCNVRVWYTISKKPCKTLHTQSTALTAPTPTPTRPTTCMEKGLQTPPHTIRSTHHTHIRTYTICLLNRPTGRSTYKPQHSPHPHPHVHTRCIKKGLQTAPHTIHSTHHTHTHTHTHTHMYTHDA